MYRTFFVAVTLAVIGLSSCFPHGAPTSVCDSMFPGHGTGEQKGESPYTISATKTNLGKGEEVSITIEGTPAFKGFLVEVRDENDKAVGQFRVDPDDNDVKALDCHDSTATAVTQKAATEKERVTLNWVAPDKEGSYTTLVTIVQKYDTFWVKLRGSAFTVTK